MTGWAKSRTCRPVRTQDFDVVIIGAGLSGVCAARAAAEEGAKVAIVEKSSSSTAAAASMPC